MGSTERRLADLERRVERLEGMEQQRVPQSAGGDALELLARLRAGVGGGERTGTIMYAGAAGFGEREYLFAKEHETAELAGADWTAAAGALEALGSPARLALLAALLDGPLKRTELQAILGAGSTGQLYHHVRELQAAGLLRQPERGVYEFAAPAVVPLLTIVAAALDLGDRGQP